MAGASDERPAASATGSLATRPLVHLLVYARNHRLTGKLELHAPDGRAGSLSLWRGLVHDARTQPAVAYFGTVAYELGLIDTPTLDATLLEISRSKRLHGEVLVERGALTPLQRDQVLVEQACRKTRFLLALPQDASFAFYTAEASELPPSFTLDPIRLAWLGLVAHPPLESVREVAGRFASLTLRVVNETGIARAGLEPDELAICEALGARPMTLAQLGATATLSQARLELLVYLLVITKCVESARSTSSAAVASSSPRSSSSVMRAAARPETTDRSSLSFRVPSVPAMKASSSSSQRIAAVLAESLSPADMGAAGIAHRAQAITREDPLTILGLPPDASAEAARAAYFRLSKLWHPDRLPADLAMFRSEVETIFDHMTRAHQTLTDPDAHRAATHGTSADTPAGPRSRSETLRAIEQALARREFHAAEVMSRQLTSVDAEDAEAHALAGWASTFGGDAPDATLRAAMHTLDRAVQLDRHCASAHYFRGMLHKRLKNNVAAFRDLLRAVQLDPRHVDAEREVRIFEMRARKGSGEHALDELILKTHRR